MAEKKTEVMTIRMTAATKAAIVREAERREWSPSKMAEKILTAWAEQEDNREISIQFRENTIQTVNIK